MIQILELMIMELIPMMTRVSKRRVSVGSLEHEMTVPSTVSERKVSSSEVLLEDTPASQACVAQKPSRLNVSCVKREDGHDADDIVQPKTLPVDPWKFALLKDIIRRELKAGRDLTDAVSEARVANLAPSSIRGKIYTDWDGLRDVMRTFGYDSSRIQHKNTNQTQVHSQISSGLNECLIFSTNLSIR